jgi:hypothetical protein
MRMVAEVIASAFASGFSWGGDAAGKRAYCAPPDLKGPQIMGAFEAFVRDNPASAERPYGETMAATLRKAFPCNAQGTYLPDPEQPRPPDAPPGGGEAAAGLRKPEAFASACIRLRAPPP